MDKRPVELVDPRALAADVMTLLIILPVLALVVAWGPWWVGLPLCLGWTIFAITTARKVLEEMNDAL